MVTDALDEYNAKRDFDKTSEPAGEATQSDLNHLSFVIQKHAATRLHYDFRLEFNGILLSWAVPKGPSPFPQHKRLAVRTEDHPLSYRDFEGIIAANQYGAGPVMVWDRGEWEPLENDVAQALKKGKIRFRLHGEKLHGEWSLARMKDKASNRENWLLIKGKDNHAFDKDDPEFLARTDFSVKTQRSFEEIMAGNNTPHATSSSSPKKPDETEDIAALEKSYHSPQLATLSESPPKGTQWIHEVKYDGYRILVYYVNKQVRIRTRNGHDWTDKFPQLKRAFEKLEIGSFVIDGEAVVLDSNGLSDFKALQNALNNDDAPMQAFFFDVLYANGESYLSEPFSARRQALERLFTHIPANPLFLSEIVEGSAKQVIAKACELGLEGIISKKRSAKYIQKRSKAWLKSKCEQRQEFIICGYLPSSALDNAIGSLHLGYHKNGELVYAGKVGTGFDQQHAQEIYARLKTLKVKTSPFPQPPATGNDTTNWVRPELLCEVKFAMWTASGKIRHASFQGLRADKSPQNIVKETPETPPTRKVRQKGKRVQSVMITHPDRTIFADSNVSKGRLAEYYSVMGDDILSQIAQRPVSVLRCPEGAQHECFFQRTKGTGMPEHVYPIEVKYKDKEHEYFYIKSVTGLIELVQMGTIEVHPWSAKIDAIGKPDRLIFDLDPDEAIPFEAIKLAALDVKRRLEAFGLTSWVKCTGGKGLHVIAPIQRRHEWPVVKTFCHAFAQAMVEDVPQAYTANMSKKQRKGKIFIDYLRNDYASTAVMDYCVRARSGAYVATPLRWDELDNLDAANQFSIVDVLARKEKGELFQYPELRQSLTQEMLSSI